MKYKKQVSLIVQEVKQWHTKLYKMKLRKNKKGENCAIYLRICFGNRKYLRQESMFIQKLLHTCIKKTMDMDKSKILLN